MPRIAVIQNGTDVARSTWADTAECYRRCAELASDEVTSVTVDFFADEAAGPVFAAADPADVAALVFVTNALTSDAVQRAARRHADRLEAYVRGGGGLLILHQWLDDLSMVLPTEICPPMRTRTSPAPDPRPLRTRGRDDVLLHFPHAVDVSALRDGGHSCGPSWVYFKAFGVDSLQDIWKPVILGGTEEAVLLRTDDHTSARVVLCTALLDWQRNVPLLTNAIRWTALATPQRLVRGRAVGGQAAFMYRWLAMDGHAVVRFGGSGGELEGIERWLLTAGESQVDMLVVHPGDVEAMLTTPEVRSFLARGGTMLTAEAVEHLSATRITAHVGDYAERTLAQRLTAELRAVDGWRSVESAFDLRNIAGAVTLLWEGSAHEMPGAVEPAEIAAFVPEIRRRLADPRHQDDVPSSVALLQTVAILGAGRPGDLGLLERTLDTPLARAADVRLQLRAIRAVWTGAPDRTFLTDAASHLSGADADLASASGVVRVLDAVAMLYQSGLLLGAPVEVMACAEAVADQLDAFPPSPQMGWLSSEATADVVQGVLALLNLLPDRQSELAGRLTRHAAVGVSVLRQSLRLYERNPRSVAQLARLTCALVQADRTFPVGLQRLATLRWPQVPDSGGSRTAAERSLVQHLATENKRLEAERRVLADTVVAKDEFIATEQLAAGVGRAISTWLPTLLLLGGAVTVGVVVGFTSFWDFLANLGLLLTALVTVLALLFAGLGRLHLLTARAHALREALEGFAVPILSSLGKVKASSSAQKPAPNPAGTPPQAPSRAPDR